MWTRSFLYHSFDVRIREVDVAEPLILLESLFVFSCEQLSVICGWLRGGGKSRSAGDVHKDTEEWTLHGSD